MTYTLTQAALIDSQRASLLAVAPDEQALGQLVGEWSTLMDSAIVEVGGFIETYQGSNLRSLVDWADALSDAYFEPGDWASYSAFIEAAPTSITVDS